MTLKTSNEFDDAYLVREDSQLTDEMGDDFLLADSIEDDRPRYEQVISELTEFEKAQRRTEENEIVLEKKNSDRQV